MHMTKKDIAALSARLVDIVDDMEGLGASQANSLRKQFEAEITAALRPWWKFWA
jgi:hypothetical protein